MAFLRLVAASLGLASAGRYTWDDAWPKDNVSWHNATARPTGIALGIGATGEMEIHMTQRGNTEFPITTLDKEGNVLRRWGAPHVVKSHGLRHQYIPRPDGGIGEAYLWITDMGDYTVKKFDARSGALLQTLGTPGQPGTGLAPLQFGNVSDVVIPPSGVLFIADGDCLCTEGGANHRVVAVDPSNNEVLWAVGNDGTFQNPHALDYDSARNWLWVADREHNRTVALDADTGEVRAEFSVHDLAPAEHHPSINGLRVDNRRDALVLGLLPAPIHSGGGVFQVAAWDLKKSLTSHTHVSLYQEEIPLRGLHELAVHEESGDLYLALFEAGYLGHLRFTGDSVGVGSMAV